MGSLVTVSHGRAATFDVGKGARVETNNWRGCDRDACCNVAGPACPWVSAEMRPCRRPPLQFVCSSSGPPGSLLAQAAGGARQPSRVVTGLVSSMRCEHAGVSVRAVAETETRCLSLLLAVG